MHRLVLLAVLLATVTTLSAPFLFGRSIARRRHAAGLRAVTEGRVRVAAMTAAARGALLPPPRPITPEDQRAANWLARYEGVTGAAYETCSAEIGHALERFLEAGRRHYGDDYRPAARPVTAQPSIDIALSHLKGGILEPVPLGPAMHSNSMTVTGELFDTVEFMRMMDAEAAKA
jgi:hypothetical protein